MKTKVSIRGKSLPVLEQAVSFQEETYFNRLPADVVEMSKRCLLDLIAAAIAGYQSGAAMIAVKAGDQLGRGQNCTIIGRVKPASLLAAGFVNSTLGSALDLDDGHRGAVGHPGVMVIPAALAAAETAPAVSGRDFITAVVVGYELAIRCGMVMNSAYDQRFYGSGGWAVFGAAAAAAGLFGLKDEQYRNALAIGEVYGPTAQCGKSIACGSMTKESIGWGVVTALYSCHLAREGFTGPGDILMDDALYKPASKSVFETLGHEYEILNTYFKLYPSCRWSHSSLVAAINIRAKYRPVLARIKSIRVETFNKALTLDHKRPSTTEAAQYSIPFIVATALKYGTVEADKVLESNLEDPDILALLEKVHLEGASELERLFPASRPARVIVEMDGGTIYRDEVHLVPGDPEHPLSWDDLTAKFHHCTGRYLPKVWGVKVIDTITHLENIKSIREFTTLLRVPVLTEAMT